MSKFSTQHYNAISKEIREIFPIDRDYYEAATAHLEERAILTTLALNLAKRFADDNERFDPLRFLDACSPNTDLYPLSELWDDADVS